MFNLKHKQIVSNNCADICVIIFAVIRVYKINTRRFKSVDQRSLLSEPRTSNRIKPKKR